MTWDKKRLRPGGFAFLTKVRDLDQYAAVTSSLACKNQNLFDKNKVDLAKALTKCLSPSALSIPRGKLRP